MSLPTSPSSTDPPVELLPTHSAAAKNDVSELARLVGEHSTLTASDTKETPLHAAARSGSKDALRWLLENTETSPLDKAANGNTAAHYAAVYGHLGALKVCGQSLAWRGTIGHLM